MDLPILYLGPGIGVGTIVIVIIVLAIVLASMLMIIWTPIKKIFKRLRNGSNSGN